MILTDQQMIDFIIDEMKKVGKLHFRDNDLYKTFLAGKEIEFRAPAEEMLPSEFVSLDYKYFKDELFSYLKKHNIPFIRLGDDNIDIFASKLVHDDYLKTYQLQDKIYRLSVLIADPRTPVDEKIEILATQSDLEEEKDKILSRYGE